MSERKIAPGESTTVSSGNVVIKVEPSAGHRRSPRTLLLLGLLAASIMMNILLLTGSLFSVPSSGSVRQQHRAGNAAAADKLAVIRFTGTIMPPFTERWIDQIRDAAIDASVKGVLLEIDSPGGLVADSHQIYHELQKLWENKPVYVAMKRMAASGGYYIAMGAGPDARIFVEPTTWTGSIGVIIPRYNAAGLASKIGVTSEPLATGPLKGSLDPFRELREDEKEVWKEIIDDSFARFISVIAENRSSLSEDDVRHLATGQVYTAAQALASGLVDEPGFAEDAIEALATSLNLTDYNVVEYSSPAGLIDMLLGATEPQPDFMKQLLEASVPRALYYCSWNPLVPVHP